MKRLLPLLITLLLTLSVAEAAERYVSGIPIPLRAEPDTANRQILQLLPVGEAVKLGKKKKNSFTQVTTQSGISGWIPTRYLTEKSPVSATKGGAQKQVQYTLEINRLKSTISSMQQEKQIIEAESQKLKENVHRANLEVDTIRDVNSSALELEQQNALLRNQIRTQKRELDVLEQANQALQDRKGRDSFMVGALVVLFSLFSGFFLARLRSGGGRNSNRI